MGNRRERQAGSSWGAPTGETAIERCAYFKALGHMAQAAPTKDVVMYHPAGSKVGASSLHLDLKMQDKQVQRL